MSDDIWCVVYDCGKFDHVVVDCEDYRVCRSYVAHLQCMYDKPLQIVLKEEVRQLIENWKTVDFCIGGTVIVPGMK